MSSSVNTNVGALVALQNLNATTNLFNVDSSTALIFKFSKDYPPFHDELFANGMEIASIIFFGVAEELVKVTGDGSWLHKPYDPTDLG